MTDILTITGLVATPPRRITTAENLKVTSFRLASSLRKFDRKKNCWVETGTNWYTVSSYRQLAVNVGESVHKGDLVVVTGRLRIRDWGDGERSGTNIDLDADAVGHDLNWGTTEFVRTIRSSDEAGTGGDEPTESNSESESYAESGQDDDASSGAPLELEPVVPF